MVQIIQFLHMQGDPFHFLSNVLNSEIFSVVLIPLLIEFHNLVQSVVISRLDYCNSTYIGLPTTTTHKLQLSHNAAARIINKTRRHEHITPILQELHWLPIMKRVQFKVLVYTFKAFHNEAPIYLCDLLLWYHPNRPLRSANRISLVPNRHRTVKLSRRLLDTAAATLWNDLTDNIRNCDNTWTFKKLLKTYLF